MCIRDRLNDWVMRNHAMPVPEDGYNLMVASVWDPFDALTCGVWAAGSGKDVYKRQPRIRAVPTALRTQRALMPLRVLRLRARPVASFC